MGIVESAEARVLVCAGGRYHRAECNIRPTAATVEDLGTTDLHGALAKQAVSKQDLYAVSSPLTQSFIRFELGVVIGRS